MTCSARFSTGSPPSGAAGTSAPTGIEAAEPVQLDVIEQSAHRLMINLVVAALDLDRMARLGAVPEADEARAAAQALASYLRRSGYMSEDAMARICCDQGGAAAESDDDVIWIPTP